MVSVIFVARRFGSAMIDHVGMGKTVNRVLAMAKGKRRGRHHEAKCSESCKDDREPEAKPGRE
jgi:hypothetical protein